MTKCKHCDEELKDVIAETVRETLTTLGIQAGDPIETQRDFQFLRDMRRATASARAKAFLGMVGLLATGVAYALWEGIKSALHRSSP